MKKLCNVQDNHIKETDAKKRVFLVCIGMNIVVDRKNIGWPLKLSKSTRLYKIGWPEIQ